MQFSTEPYLIEIGDNVAIANGVQFVTHDGLANVVHLEQPELQVFGRIRVGSGCAIGINSILLPGTEIGRDCIVGAGTVVRGCIPENSLVIGNPGKVVGRASLLRKKLLSHPNRLDVFNTSPQERRRRIEEHFQLK